MSEGTDQAKRRDGFIAVRENELIGAIGAPGDPMADVCAMLDALLHHEAHARLEALKALYDPLDPDAPELRRDQSPGALDAFEAALGEALARANFEEMDPSDVQTQDATKLLTGLSIRPDASGIRRIRYFARGAHDREMTRSSWFGLIKRRIQTQVLRDVVVLVSFQGEDEIRRRDRRRLARMRRGMRPGATLLKHFREIAAPELVTLHPGAKPAMLPVDQFWLVAPAIVAGAPVMLNLLPAIGVIAAVLAAYFGAHGVIEDSDLKRALAAISGLVAVGAFVMRQRLKFEAQSLRYQKQLADTIYFRNLANNAGVIDLLVGAGEDQDAKEALLAYWTLRRSERPLSKAEIDRAAESFLRERFKLEINFEIFDALGKLERLGLVTRDGDSYQAVPPADALAQLDAAWDGLFHFSARRG
ncbi:MAG: DUF3754 domain-containing protein [Terricaulis sp.]